MHAISIRHAKPEDHQPIIAVLDDWWGGRQVSNTLHKLFFIHFRETSFVAEEEGKLIGFLVGFLSQTFIDEAYIHFVGVHPERRKGGVGRNLYERFFDAASKDGRNTVRCITSPVNKTSIAFHLSMGFEIEAQETEADGVPVYRNYDGRGRARVLFVKRGIKIGGSQSLLKG
jgi:predicted GNAT superfamily acetyltransferase